MPGKEKLPNLLEKIKQISKQQEADVAIWLSQLDIRVICC